MACGTYNQIKGQSVSDNDLGVFPIYIGAKGEENQGLNQVYQQLLVRELQGLRKGSASH